MTLQKPVYLEELKQALLRIENNNGEKQKSFRSFTASESSWPRETGWRFRGRGPQGNRGRGRRGCWEDDHEDMTKHINMRVKEEMRKMTRNAKANSAQAKAPVKE